ncbi:MAG: hypothetical protein P4L16_06170 [Chlamydiales bacterium]|nr:hypothetical protein [Chlamydiales bacterium]
MTQAIHNSAENFQWDVVKLKLQGLKEARKDNCWITHDLTTRSNSLMSRLCWLLIKHFDFLRRYFYNINLETSRYTLLDIGAHVLTQDAEIIQLFCSAVNNFNSIAPKHTVSLAPLCTAILNDDKKSLNLPHFFQSNRKMAQIIYPLLPDISKISFQNLEWLAESFIKLKDAESLQSIFKAITLKQASELAIYILNKRKKELCRPSPLREHYVFALKNLKQCHPFLKNYFLLNHSMLLQGDDGLGYAALSTEGIQLIFSKLRNKASLGNMNILLSSHFAEFQEQLRLIFEDFKKNNDLQKCCFVIRNRLSTEQERHMTPIYLEKREGILNILILDCRGGFSISKWDLKIIEIIKKAYIESDSTSKLEIYTHTGSARQSDYSTCSIFSIRDVVHLAQESDAIMAQITQNKRVRVNEQNVYEVEFLPPRMMETTQSIKTINQYTKQTGTENMLIFSRSKPLGKTLSQVLQKHTVMFNNGLKNMKIANLFLKYETMVISAAILQGH